METNEPIKNMPPQGDFSFLTCREIGNFMSLTFKIMCNYSHLWAILYDLPDETDFITDLPEEFRNLYNNYFHEYDIIQFSLGMKTMRLIAREGWEAWVTGVRNA